MKPAAKFILSIFVVLLIVSCSNTPKEHVVEVTAKDFQFVVKDSIPSGWTTFRFNNTGHTEHFFLLNKVPDSISFERYKEEVTHPFDIVFDSLKAGASRETAIGMLISQIPSWYFSEVKPMGGCGILSMGKTADAISNLSAGRYVMECYIKELGVFHTALGMIKEITVTDEKNNMNPPSFNMELTLTNSSIEASGALNKGENVIAVHYKEQPEAGLGNDVHVIELQDSTVLDSVVNWLDWMNITGLQSPSPVKFFGGVQEMPVGSTSYFRITLPEGSYAFIAETGASRGLIKKFTIQ